MRIIIVKKILPILLIALLVLGGCTKTENNETAVESDVTAITSETTQDDSAQEIINEFHLDDPEELEAYQELLYQNIVEALNSDQYFVEEVQVEYYSQEYLEDVIYNSKESVYFGHTLSELENQFKGTKYAFTLGDNGETVVHEFKNYDFTTETLIKNVAIGTGVIVVCVIISIATDGASVPGAVVVIHQVVSGMAKGAISLAVSGAVFGGVTAGLMTGFETGDFDKAVKAAALEASESYKWGAIIGAASGGVAETITLAYASSGALSISEAAFIQYKNPKLPVSFIKNLSSIEQYYELETLAANGGLSLNAMASIYKETNYPIDLIKTFKTTKEGYIYSEQAGLFAQEVNGRLALIRDIDLNYVTDMMDDTGHYLTNLERMKLGYAAIDPATGEAYQLHHIGQTVDSPLAILTPKEHTGGGNNSILHDPNIGSGNGVHSIMPDAEWARQKQEFWKALAKLLE